VSETTEHFVRVERQGKVAVVTIAHPPANAISRAVIAGVGQALYDAEADPECGAVILTGDGPKFFAAGADITEFLNAGGESIGGGQELTLRMERSRLPIIAAVNGIAFGGGCELALACDVRIAAENARFGQPEIKLGIIPGWGGTQRLPRLIARGVAMEMLLSGDPIDAARAREVGLVNRVVPQAELMAAALELAGRLAQQAPLAVAATKRAVAHGLSESIADGLAVELDHFVQIFTTDDAREGVTAFLEKRPAQWKGR
jgi:enoyl-CoA hydratase